MDTDFLLIHRMKNGDDTAIETFVRKYYSVILRYCHLHIKDQSYAEDATQEVFARFFRTLNQYQHILNMIMKKMKTNKSAQDQLLGGFSVMALLLNGIFNAKPP